MPTVRDHLWLWGHEAGCQNDIWGLPADSHITQIDAARYLGAPNLIQVAYRGKPEPPLAPHAEPLRPLSRVVWSIVGDSSSTRNDQRPDLDEVLDLAVEFPNISGAMMDDFFHPPDEQGRIARYSVEQIAGFRDRLHQAVRPLDLWVVLYSHQLDLPAQEHLAQTDVVSFWTWHAKDLAGLEANFARAEALAPAARKMLGCYMWDYGAKQPMPAEQMARQCETGLGWLRQGRINGMILLASCICDLRLPAVEWTREWIGRVGEERL